MFAVYKNYDDNCPDTMPFWFFTKEKDAVEAVNLLNSNKEAGEQFAFIDGFEWCGKWDYKSWNPTSTSLREFIEIIANI